MAKATKTDTKYLYQSPVDSLWVCKTCSRRHATKKDAETHLFEVHGVDVERLRLKALARRYR